MQGIFGRKREARTGADSFLGRLARDTRGNVMAIMAAALIPFCGMVGGGIDLSRMYLTKTRLQHACDAGALAGRKQMGAGLWGSDDNTAAIQYFDANFADGAYGSAGLTKSYAEAAGKVTGTATATVPMTLMRVLGKTQETLTVACDAEMRLPNTDIMFVLDTTGSMEDKAVSTDTQTKIVALKSAVKCFYEIVARLDTAENCTTGAPSGGVGNQVQVRFGFVPYATNVNVGKLLPTGWFADSWAYQSREPIYNTTTATTWPPFASTTGPSITVTGTWPPNYGPDRYSFGCGRTSGTTTATSTSSTNSNEQINGNVKTYTTTTVVTTTSTQTEVWNVSWLGCFFKTRAKVDTVTTVSTHTATATVTTVNTFVNWRYAKINQNIAGLKNGTTWNDSFQAPIGNTTPGATTMSMKTIDWDGCIEERATIRAASYTSTTGGAAKDLDIDTVPSAGDPSSLWGPALHGMIYARGSYANSLDTNDIPGFNRNELTDNNNYATIDGNNQDSYFCPAEGRKLQEWDSASGFEGYVDGLTTGGNTYHDIGLLWGARFLSPTGIFSSGNAFTPQGGEIDRNLIFMTDGETCTGSTNYGPYGLPWYDRRQTDDGTVPTYGCETETWAGGMLSEQVNARYAALCTAVKNKNITLWVIWFGVSKPNLEARLTACATPNRFYAARNAAALQTTFASIANQISQLRLTR